MNEEDSHLIDTLYAASTGEIPLLGPMELYSNMQGDGGAGVWHYDSVAGTTTDVETIVVNKELLDFVATVFSSYAERHGSIENPLIDHAVPRLLAGEVLINTDVMTMEELAQHPYFHEVWEPLGILQSMAWVAAGKGQKWLTFTTSRLNDVAPYTNEHFERAALFRRHMSRALQIMEMVEASVASEGLFEKVVDVVPSSIALVDDRLNILYLNSSAETLMREGGTLSIRDNKFQVGSSNADSSKFEHWWKLHINSADASGGEYLEMPKGGVWSIDTTRVSNVGAPGNKSRRWLLSLKQRPSSQFPSPEYLLHRFGLSKAEARVCAALCANYDAISVAKLLNITPDTVRSHLKSAFRKTGTANQVQLAITLMEGF